MHTVTVHIGERSLGEHLVEDGSPVAYLSRDLGFDLFWELCAKDPDDNWVKPDHRITSDCTLVYPTKPFSVMALRLERAYNVSEF